MLRADRTRRFSFLALFLLALGAAVARGQAVPSNQPAPPSRSVSAAGARPGTAPAGFTLTPQQQAYLDQVLAAWERQSQSIKTLSATFTLWDRDETFNKVTQHTGEVRYQAPDKGLYRVLPDTQRDDPGEYWICDGQSVFEFNYASRRLIERPLPPESRGVAIADGPLPFLFNQTAAKLKQRYFLRVVTPQDASRDEVWLEAFPRWANDAANFSKVDVILKEHQQVLHLYALKVHLPGGKNTRSYVFAHPDPRQRRRGEVLEINKQNFFGQAAITRPRTPFGWKHVVEQPPTAPGPSQSAPPRSARQSPPPAPGTR